MERLFRIKQICGPGGILPISKASWWKGVKEGKYPQPVKLSPRCTCWRESDIRAIVENGAQQ